MSLPSALATLANYRSHNTRASQDIVAKGALALKSNSLSDLGDEQWAFLEQLALAALDVGRLELATDCLRRLADKFPDSPRVDALTGIRMEASESPETVLKYYDQLLEADSANGPAWKRRVSVIRRTGKIEKAAEELCRFLDTFYNDVEGWLELADIYASCNQYTQSLQALSHALLLAPQNPFYFLQFAETAYTADDIPLAMKMFLVVVEMSETEVPAENVKSEGIAVRAWWGVKLCCRRVIQGAPCPSQSGTPLTSSKNVHYFDVLSSDRIMTTYTTTPTLALKDPAGKTEVFRWMAPN